MRSVWVLMFALLFLCRSNGAFGFRTIESKDKLIEFFSTQDYKGDIQVWSAEGGRNGYVFFASGDGLSVYDGTRWLFPESDGERPANLKSLYYDFDTDLLYSGGDNEFGVWGRNEYGQFIYTRLYVNKKADQPKMFWRIAKSGGRIYFGAMEGIFSYYPVSGRIDQIMPEVSFYFMHVVGEHVYAQEGHTLYLLDGVKKQPLPYDFDDRITGIYPDSLSNSLYLFREDRGIYVIAANGKLSELNAATNRLIGKNKLFSMGMTGDGTYLLGTILGGLFQVDREGNVIRNIDKSSGLPNSSVLNVTTDSDGNIWMGLEGGIARLDNSPNESYLTDYEGEIGGVYAVYDEGQLLYIGTNKGIYICREGRKFEFINGTQGQTWNIENVDGEIIACHDRGVFRLEGNRAVQLSTEGTWSLQKVPFSESIYISSNYNGFKIFRKEGGKIAYVGPVNNFRGEARVTGFDKQGFFWSMGTGEGFYRFVFSKDFSTVTNYKLYKVPEIVGLMSLFKIDNELIFYSGENAYRYDSLKDTLLPDEYAQSILKQCGKDISFFRQFGKYFWYINRNGVGYIVREHNHLIVHSELFNGAYDKKIPWVFQKMVPLSDGSYAYGLQNQVGLYSIGTEQEAMADTCPMFSSVEMMVEGHRHYGSLEKGQISLPAVYDNIRIYLLALNKSKLIEYRIKGYSEDWTLLKLDDYLELPRLRPGIYKLEIRNYQQKTTDYLTLDICIERAWYFSVWAISGYIILVLLGLGVIYLYHRGKMGRLVKREEEKRFREREMFEKERLEADLREKDKKLASFMMNELNKNNLLTDIRSDLVGFLDKEQYPDKIKSALRKIDKQLDSQEDWKVFLKYFNNIYSGFLDRLESKYPQLTLSDMKLCAYLRLNLTTKEMAVLLNISPTSVDTARHRLRKKLDIDNKVNLSQFLAEI